MISMATSLINTQVRTNVQAVLDENRLGQGRFIKEFEDKVAAYMGAKHAIATCNGSMADYATLAALKALRPDKTEVILPALTFIAHANAIMLNGLTPVFVDVMADYQIDVSKIRITNKTLAIFPVHLLGKACEIERIVELAKFYDVFVIEDCCEAYGGEVAGKKLGTFGDYGTFSFFPSHTITTGEGGMIIANDDTLADLARRAIKYGRRSEDILDKFHFDFMGFNGKMSNLTAAVGAAIVETADEVIAKRRKNVELFNELTGGDWYASSPHCYPFSTDKRDEVMRQLDKSGIDCRKVFSSLPTEKCYARYRGSFPMAETIGREDLFLPVHQELTEDDIRLMVSYL